MKTRTIKGWVLINAKSGALVTLEIYPRLQQVKGMKKDQHIPVKCTLTYDY